MSLPIEDLITTLLARTRDGTIRWEQADTRGNKYYARRGSGNVVISGPGTALVPIGLTPDSQPPSVTLDVNDAQNQTVEHVEAKPRNSFFAMTQFDPPAIRDLMTLYNTVKEQVTQGNATMRALNEEFNSPDPPED
jgi:hypothetical protein